MYMLQVEHRRLSNKTRALRFRLKALKKPSLRCFFRERCASGLRPGPRSLDFHELVLEFPIVLVLLGSWSRDSVFLPFKSNAKLTHWTVLCGCGRL